MAYCSLDDLKEIIPEDNLIQLTDDNNIGIIDQSKIDTAISNADIMIDGYLRGHYDLPLDPVPGIIKKISTDIALYNLYSRRFEMDIPDGMRDRYKNALKLLELIQSGKVTIMNLEASESRVYKTNKSSDDRMFPKETLDQY